jgi:hypothetical protein
MVRGKYVEDINVWISIQFYVARSRHKLKVVTISALVEQDASLSWYLWLKQEYHHPVNSCDHRCLDRVAIHHAESLEDSSDVICLRYMDLAIETLTNNVEAEES